MRWLAVRGWLVPLGLWAAGLRAEVAGVPATRLYQLEEIGGTARNLQLLHDSYGRVAVAQQDELFLLNDTSWQTAWRGDGTALSFNRVVCSPDGEIFFGTFGSWGVIRKSATGELSPVPLVPPEAPAWVQSCEFREIYCTGDGVFFWGQDGVVHLDRASGTHRYFPLGGVSWLFPFAGKFVVSTFRAEQFLLDVATGTLTPGALAGDLLPPVIGSAGDGVSSLLLVLASGQLLALRDGRLEPVRRGEVDRFSGPVGAMVALAEGGFALSYVGHGVLLLDHRGEVRRVLDGSDFKGVTALSSHEPGVLWAVTKRGVLKILHRQPFCSFGIEQGLSVSWPQVVRWRDRTLVASGGWVFEEYADRSETGGGFRRLAGQPGYLVWGIVSMGDSLLIGDGAGVHEMTASGESTLVLPGVNVARLVALDDETVLAIATDTMVALRRRKGEWVECAPRLAGVGYPYVVHAGSGTGWIELGLNRVAQVSLVDDRLRLRVLETFAWTERSWVNVSIVGPTVVLSGSGRIPMFLDDRTLEPVEAPELRRLVERSPYLLQRLAQDDTGALWVSHSRGLFLARRRPGGYEPDFKTFSGINEATPLVRCPAGGGVWASTSNTLYRLDHRINDMAPAPVRPMLVALHDTRAGRRLALPAPAARALGAFPHSQNSLRIDLFAGSYAPVRAFSYEYRLGGSSWVRSNTGSSVFLSDLHEGDYALEVRVVDPLGPVGSVASYRFSVAPPWYRTWVAFAAYPLLGLLVLHLLARYFAHRHRARLAELEQQVGLRTAELRTAMDCLREEATTSATLAERNRLAGEIHDSLEQGLAGLSLQLETTTRLPGCGGPVKTALAAALDMVLYCRDELRNAVRGLHSPVLQTEPLEAALQRVVGQLAPLAGLATVRTEGTPCRIDPATEHHLLRIAQEALGNAVKHAEATRIEVVLSYAKDHIVLAIRDDGRGFDPSTVVPRAGCHLGLPSFRDRAAKIGGTVEVDSAPGRGTTVRVVVPRSEACEFHNED